MDRVLLSACAPSVALGVPWLVRGRNKVPFLFLGLWLSRLWLSLPGSPSLAVPSLAVPSLAVPAVGGAVLRIQAGSTSSSARLDGNPIPPSGKSRPGQAASRHLERRGTPGISTRKCPGGLGQELSTPVGFSQQIPSRSPLRSENTTGGPWQNLL